MNRKTLWLCAAATLMAGGCGDAMPAGSEESAVADAPAGTQGPLAGETSEEPAKITCDYPVRRGDTRASLIERMGKDARVEEVAGPEGMDFDALVLWPDDPARRLEVIFMDDAMTERGSVRIYGEASDWRAAGLGLGSTLAEVEARNGGPFTLMGFEWDYGGLVMDWLGGELERLPGGCRAGAHMGYADETGEVPMSLVGDVELRSDLPAMRELQPEVAELWLAFVDE